METAAVAPKTVNPVLYNTSTKPTTKTDNNPEQDNNGAMIATALAGLAVISAAAIAAAKKGKVPGNVKGQVKGAVETGIKTAEQKGKKAAGTAVKTAEEAVTRVANGENYSQVRKAATENLQKSDKKVVKEALSDALTQKRQAEAAVRQNMINNSSAIRNAKGSLNNAAQGMKSATQEQLSGKVQAGAEEDKKASQAAKELAQKAAENPTHKNKKFAQVAHNNAIGAELKAKDIETKAAQKAEELAQKAAQKAENIARMEASPNFEQGQKKMQENAAKTAENAIKRAAKRDVSRPGYQRALSKLRSASPEKLEGVINSSNSSNVEKQVAADLLASIKK